MKAEHTIQTILLILLWITVIPALPYLIVDMVLEGLEARIYD